MKDNILIVDIETTGFSHENDYIVEIGIVALNVMTGLVTPLIDEVTWEKGITKEICDNSWICKNSTLTSNEIRLGNNFSKIKNLIQTIINHYPLGITAFNNEFDFRFLENRGIKLNKKLACPMKLLTNVIKLPKANFKGGYKYPKVTEAYNYFFPNEEYNEAHRGLSDAMDEAKIVFEMIKLGMFKI